MAASQKFCMKEKVILEEALSSFHQTKIKIISKPGKKDKGLLEICKSNTKLAFNSSNKDIKDISSSLLSLKLFMNLNCDIKLIESYDVSHHSSKNAIAGCVVYGKKGKIKEKYRMFNISKECAGNDIASMEEVIRRRFSNTDIGLDNNIERSADSLKPAAFRWPPPPLNLATALTSKFPRFLSDRKLHTLRPSPRTEKHAPKGYRVSLASAPATSLEYCVSFTASTTWVSIVTSKAFATLC